MRQRTFLCSPQKCSLPVRLYALCPGKGMRMWQLYWSHFFPRLGEALALILLLRYHPFVPPWLSCLDLLD